jgi:hypothetical protein
MENEKINWALVAVAVVALLAYALQSYRLNETYAKNVSIPSSDMVNAYCHAQGFKHGWLSSSCGVNEVQCYREVGDLSQTKCVKWESAQ